MSTISETNEGYIFEGWDHEQETIQNLLSVEESLENLMEIKNVLEVGKARALHEHQLGEGQDSDDETGTTTYLNFLAAKIIYYDKYLKQINGKINRFNSKGGGRRKKKSEKNIRMRKKTRRKRGADKDDLYEKRKKPLTFGQKTCKSKRDCKSNEICSGGNEKNKGVCVKPIIKYTGELHYDNPRQKLLASLEPLDGYKGWFYDNKTNTYRQYDLKRKKFLYQSNKHPADIKRQRAISSIKRKWTRKFGKKGGKRKKKTRKHRKKKTRRKRRRKKAGMPRFKRTKSLTRDLNKYKRPIIEKPKQNLRKKAMVRTAQKAAKKTSETGVDEITKALENL